VAKSAIQKLEEQKKLLFRPVSWFEDGIGVRASIFESKVNCFHGGDVYHIVDVLAVGGGCFPLLHPDQLIKLATQPICLEMLFLRNPRIDFALGMSPVPYDVEELMFVSSMPFTTVKSNAKVGLRRLDGTVSALELARTMLAGPQN
jgi:hypothetical protein